MSALTANERALTDKLSEAVETIRQLRETVIAPSTVRYPGMDFTRAEREVLEALLITTGTSNRDRLRRQMTQTRRASMDAGPKSVDVVVCRLRKKLSDLSPPVRIRTERGSGFFIDVANKARLRLLREPSMPRFEPWP